MLLRVAIPRALVLQKALSIRAGRIPTPINPTGSATSKTLIHSDRFVRIKNGTGQRIHLRVSNTQVNYVLKLNSAGSGSAVRSLWGEITVLNNDAIWSVDWIIWDCFAVSPNIAVILV